MTDNEKEKEKHIFFLVQLEFKKIFFCFFLFLAFKIKKLTLEEKKQFLPCLFVYLFLAKKLFKNSVLGIYLTEKHLKKKSNNQEKPQQSK